MLILTINIDKKRKESCMGEKMEVANIEPKQIRKEMIEQLVLLNKNSSYNHDLINSYMYQLALKSELERDILENGLRYKVTTGNGFESSKANESVERLKKCNELMLNIITKLGLDREVLAEVDENDIY